MSWRRLIQQLMNQEQVIRSLEDSAPIRKAAKYTVYLVQKGKQMAQEGVQNIKDSPILKDAEDKTYENSKKRKSQYESFKDNFSHELEQGFRDLKRRSKGGK